MTSELQSARICEAGDAALLLELDAVIDAAVNARAITVAAAIKAAEFSGVRDVIPTFRSVAVHFDPLATDVAALARALRDAAASDAPVVQGPIVEVPVSYGGDDGPDLPDVAAFAHVSVAEVIERHSAVDYRVFMLGFLPGFPYIGIVDETIAAPRKPTPRMRVPSGSVGIAGRQTGIYPQQSPGGWQLIGRTPLPLFDPSRDPASLFAPGDRVRFIPTREGAARRASDGPEGGSPNSQDAAFRFGRSVTVLRPGLFTTVQDLGRWGYQQRGVPVAGPMDPLSHHVANAAVGNPANCASLEATLTGPELRFEQLTVVAVSGADFSASIDGVAVPLNTPRACAPGAILRFGERRGGARAYIACDGGFDVPRVLGSRATHVMSRFGGIDGRPLKAGDNLLLGNPRDVQVQGPSLQTFGSRETGGAHLRVIRGPQDNAFDDTAFETLERSRFVVSPQSDRMGYRLTGATIVSRAGRPRSSGTSDIDVSAEPLGAMISDAAFTGGIQVTPSGNPILLMADHQTTGGYPQIATVITADIPIAGQLAPGDWVEFTLCTRAEAIAALAAQKDALRG